MLSRQPRRTINKGCWFPGRARGEIFIRRPPNFEAAGMPSACPSSPCRPAGLNQDSRDSRAHPGVRFSSRRPLDQPNAVRGFRIRAARWRWFSQVSSATPALAASCIKLKRRSPRTPGRRVVGRSRSPRAHRSSLRFTSLARGDGQQHVILTAGAGLRTPREASPGCSQHRQATAGLASPQPARDFIDTHPQNPAPTQKRGALAIGNDH